MNKRIDSRSDVQLGLENYIMEMMQKKLGISVLEKNPYLMLDEDSKTSICPDFFSESERIIGEIHAHEGRLKPAQKNKIASDVLKMILYEKVRDCNFSKFIVVCDKEEYEQLSGASYLAEAIRKYEIKLLYVDIPVEYRKQLQDTMKKQNLMRE